MGVRVSLLIFSQIGDDLSVGFGQNRYEQRLCVGEARQRVVTLWTNFALQKKFETIQIKKITRSWKRSTACCCLCAWPRSKENCLSVCCCHESVTPDFPLSRGGYFGLGLPWPESKQTLFVSRDKVRFRPVTTRENSLIHAPFTWKWRSDWFILPEMFYDWSNPFNALCTAWSSLLT